MASPGERRPTCDSSALGSADTECAPEVHASGSLDELLRQAARGSKVHTHLLAAVVVHEVHHLAGASEVEARRGEAAFIERLVRQQRISPQVAGRYMEELSRAMRQLTEQTQ